MTVAWEPHEERVDYAKLSWQWRSHHQRFIARVKDSKLLCQECGGAGGDTEPILDDGTGPWEECGWCEGTGKVTPWLRGMWLRFRRQYGNRIR